MKERNKRWIVALSCVFLFAMVFIWYISALPYPGPMLIGIVAGGTAVTEFILLLLSLKDCKKRQMKLQDILILCFCFFAMLGTGAFFAAWLFLKCMNAV